MPAFVTHLFGGTDEASVAALPDLIAELDQADGEHTDVSVEDESGWGLSAYPSGRVIWEDVEAPSGTDVQMTGLSRGEIVELFALFVQGDREAVANRPWVPRRA